MYDATDWFQTKTRSKDFFFCFLVSILDFNNKISMDTKALVHLCFYLFMLTEEIM